MKDESRASYRQSLQRNDALKTQASNRHYGKVKKSDRGRIMSPEEMRDVARVEAGRIRDWAQKAELGTKPATFAEQRRKAQ